VVQAKPTRSSTRRPATVKVARSPPEYTTFSWNSRMKPLSIFARKDTFGAKPRDIRVGRGRLWSRISTDGIDSPASH
jgi:hypothetical protein